MPGEDLQVTSAAEWGKNKSVSAEGSFVVEVPTGNVVRVRRTMDMMALLRAGRIPNPLAGIVQKMIDSGSPNLGKALAESQQDVNGAKASQQLLELLDQTWMRAVIEPEFDAPAAQGQLVDETGKKIKPNETFQEYMDRLALWQPAEGKISVLDVDLNDKYYVFSVAQGGATDLARFRAEQDAVVDSLHASD
jgi:hypothetical protein